jgi:hypothetical protein
MLSRHKDLITFLASVPFVAFLPVLFPNPQYTIAQLLVVLAYLACTLAVARLIAVGLARAGRHDQRPQDEEL